MVIIYYLSEKNICSANVNFPITSGQTPGVCVCVLNWNPSACEGFQHIVPSRNKGNSLIKIMTFHQ